MPSRRGFNNIKPMIEETFKKVEVSSLVRVSNLAKLYFEGTNYIRVYLHENAFQDYIDGEAVFLEADITKCMFVSVGAILFVLDKYEQKGKEKTLKVFKCLCLENQRVVYIPQHIMFLLDILERDDSTT